MELLTASEPAALANTDYCYLEHDDKSCMPEYELIFSIQIPLKRVVAKNGIIYCSFRTCYVSLHINAIKLY